MNNLAAADKTLQDNFFFLLEMADKISNKNVFSLGLLPFTVNWIRQFTNGKSNGCPGVAVEIFHQYHISHN